MRHRLFLVSAALVALGLVTAEALLVPRLERAARRRLATETARLALAVRNARERLGADPDGRLGRARAHELAGLLGARVSWFDARGAPIADAGPGFSDEVPAAGGAVAPEVAGALEGGLTSAIREEAGARWLLVALPLSGSPPAVTRVGLPLAPVERETASVRRLLLLAAGLGLVVAAALSTLAARLVSRPLLEMAAVARDLSNRRFGRRIDGGSAGETRELGEALNQLAGDLERTLGDLTRERDLLGAVLESMADGVLVTDGESRIVRTNPALRSLLPHDTLAAGRTVLEATRHPELAEHIQAVAEGRRTASGEIEIAGPPPRNLLLASARVEDPRGVVTVFHDVTELRRLERVRRDFVANVSHELRTPVAALQAAGETLLDGAVADPARTGEILAIVARNAERLGHLVTDLLELTRLESGQLKLERAPLDVAAVAGRALEAVEQRAHARRIRLEREVPDGLDFEGDERALLQVLTNLLDNAVKYTPDGGAAGVRAEADERRLRLIVWDTGPGIEPQHLERVFERFYRVDKGRSPERGGTGLGLAIVKHLVEAMGGRVTAGANPGGGARFTVEMPRRRTVVFACVHNAGRSQMAAALFNQLADPAAARAVSAGTDPAERVHPVVVEAMREVGIELGGIRPRRLTDDIARSAALLVTMGCGEACPFLPGVPTEDWPLPDPKDLALAAVREIREEIRRRVMVLLAVRGWGR